MSNSNVTVSWNAVSTATAYVVYARPCGYAHWSMIGITSTPSYTHFFATYCYEYHVVSDRWSVESGASATVKAYGLGDDYYDDPTWTNGIILDPLLFKKKQCTSFVAWRVHKYYTPGSYPTFMGATYWDGKNWAEAASDVGGTVSVNPFVGAVAQWDYEPYGHVAWVAGIDGNYVILEEYNYNNPEAYGRRRIPASDVDVFLRVK
jgi:surface antigen